jgi:redox-sensing transcriptional repressor
MRYHRIPDEAVRRLPIYLRGLLFSHQEGRESISSTKLAELLGVSPTQIRKDFSYFGGFGTPGVGYDVAALSKQIRAILKLSVPRKATLVGAGRLGSALLGYPGFRMYGFEIAAVFDNNPKKIGRKLGGITIESISVVKTLNKRKINLAIIATPGEVAQDVAESLVKAGVRGILNFAPRYLAVPKKVKVITIDIAMDLARLPYYLPAS